jgi:hypothetical protein
MSQSQPVGLKLRCPVCFARENDVVLLPGPREWYCPKCSFHGSEHEVRAMYADLRKKYRLMATRLTVEDQAAL